MFLNRELHDETVLAVLISVISETLFRLFDRRPTVKNQGESTATPERRFCIKRKRLIWNKKQKRFG